MLDEEQRRTQGVNDSDLACLAWEEEMLAGMVPAPQALADRLIAAGYVGMRVQSIAAGISAGDLSLVMWKWNSNRPVCVVLMDDKSRLSGGQAH